MPSPDEHLLSTFPYRHTIYVRGTFLRSDEGQFTFTSLQRDRVTNSVVTPGFRSRTRKRIPLPLNAYSKSVTVLSDPLTTWYAKYVEPPSYYDEHWLDINASHIAGGPQNIANAEDPTQRALANLFKTLSETKVNTLVTAAEMHKTCDLIGKTSMRLYDAYRALKRGDLTGLTRELGLTTPVGQRKRFDKRYNKAKSLDAQEHKYSDRGVTVTKSQTHVNEFVDKTWLEYSYGWKPLLGDVYNHAQALAENVIERANVVRYVKGRAKTKIVRSANSVATGDPHKIYRTSEDARWVEFGFSYKLQNGEINTFSQFGIDNPLEVLWELVPFSFVADWFINIGGFIKSLTATTGLILHAGFKSTRRHTVNTTEVWPCGTVERAAAGSFAIWSGPGMIQRSEDLQISRYQVLDWPWPEPPSFRNPFGKGEDYGLTKAMSSVALLRSLFLRRAP